MITGFAPVEKVTDATALASGFLLGDDSAFSYSMRTIVASAGVTHLVAASGANLNFVQQLWPAWGVLGWRWIRAAASGTIPLVYFLIAGESGSLWRAIIMCLLTLLGQILGRPSHLVVLLLQTVMVIAGVQLALLGSLSFQLSWLALFGVFISQSVLSGGMKTGVFTQTATIQYYCSKSLFAGLGVYSCVGPLLWWKFGVWQPLGVVTTLLLEPLVRPYSWLALGWQVSAMLPTHWRWIEFAVSWFLEQLFWIFWQIVTFMATVMTHRWSSSLSLLLVSWGSWFLFRLCVQRRLNARDRKLWGG